MSRFTVAVAVAAVLSVACRDQQPLQTRPMTGPAFLISDGAHTSGNPDFFFLPPLVSSPVGTANYGAGKFNPRLSPVVEVCRLQADPRVVPTTDCMAGVALVLPPTPMTLNGSEQQYAFNWDTKSAVLATDGFYRVMVVGALHSTPLGFLDLDPVSGGMKNLKTGDVVAFPDGRTLPIRVRIEENAFGSTNDDHVEQTVGNVATTFTTNTGFAGASFPDNWLPQAAVDAGITQVVVVIERIPVAAGTNDPTCFQSGRFGSREYDGCYRFRTDPDLHQFGAFTNNVTVGVCIERPDFLDTDESVEMFRQEEGVSEPSLTQLESVPAPFLACDGFLGTRVGSVRSGGLFDLVSKGWRALGRGIARLATPRPLYAVDFGAGGSTDFFSRFGWARSSIASPTLITCTGTPGGDETFRGFYVPSFPGTLLDRVTLHVSSRTAGTYTLAVVAHGGAYDGPVIAFDSETVTLTADDQANVATTFTFPSSPVTQGSTVAFTVRTINGPSGGIVFYSVPVDDASCPVTQTNDTTPPLSTFRRHGVNVQIEGAGPIIRER